MSNGEGDAHTKSAQGAGRRRKMQTVGWVVLFSSLRCGPLRLVKRSSPFSPVRLLSEADQMKSLWKLQASGRGREVQGLCFLYWVGIQ